MNHELRWDSRLLLRSLMGAIVSNALDMALLNVSTSVLGSWLVSLAARAGRRRGSNFSEVMSFLLLVGMAGTISWLIGLGSSIVNEKLMRW